MDGFFQSFTQMGELETSCTARIRALLLGFFESSFGILPPIDAIQILTR